MGKGRRVGAGFGAGVAAPAFVGFDDVGGDGSRLAQEIARAAEGRNLALWFAAQEITAAVGNAVTVAVAGAPSAGLGIASAAVIVPIEAVGAEDAKLDAVKRAVGLKDRRRWFGCAEYGHAVSIWERWRLGAGLRG